MSLKLIIRHAIIRWKKPLLQKVCVRFFVEKIWQKNTLGKKRVYMLLDIWKVNLFSVFWFFNVFLLISKVENTTKPNVMGVAEF